MIIKLKKIEFYHKKLKIINIMESFKYFMKFDIFNESNKNNFVINKNNNVIYNNNFVIHNNNVIKYQQDWSLFYNQEKKIIIKKNMGKLIGYNGDTIRQIRKNNNNTIIKIPSCKYNSNYNREIILFGPSIELQNTILEIKSIIGQENIIV